MDLHWNQFGMLVIALVALSGWWLAVRPRASYSGVSSTMSFLIVLMAVLLCVLAVGGQQYASGPPARPQVALAR